MASKIPQFAFVLLAIVALGARFVQPAGLAINSHLSAADRQRLQQVFADGLHSTDLQTVYFSAISFDAITGAQKTAACSHLKRLHSESRLNDFEKNFYLIAGYKHLLCASPIDEAIQNAALSKTEFATAQELYYTYFTVRSLSAKLPADRATVLAKNLLTILRKDDSLASLGYAFHVAAELGAPAASVADWIEGAVAQADEIDGKQLQFEGGLSITALVLNGAFKLTTALKKPAPLNAQQTLKFTTYLLSRRSVQLAKGASVLLEVLATIAAQPSLAPVCVQTIGNGQLTAESSVLSVRIVDVLGSAVRPPFGSVRATVRPTAGGPSAAPLLTNVDLTERSSDRTVYAIDLKQLARGSYAVVVRLSDAVEQTLAVRVLGRVRVDSAEIGVGEADSTSAVRLQPVPFGQMLAQDLQADGQQKLVLRVRLADALSGDAVRVHQAFVRLSQADSPAEIIYVAEPDAQGTYKFELDVGARSGDFAYRSGSYQLELIVGDAALSNSFRWPIANVQLRFGTNPADDERRPALPRGALRPEIEHLFRVPEPRPARIVSDLFTALCAAPLLVLFYLWSKLGVNVANFPLGVSAIGFHAGFGAILALFGVFFWRLNMFETVRYLVPLAVGTFIFGNRLLRAIAARGAKA